MASRNEFVGVRPNGTKRVKIFFDKVDESTGELLEPSMTKQAFKKESDINYILKKYEKTGVIDHLSRYNGEYGDFSGIEDYHTSLNLIQEANDMFMSLPAGIRKRFNNDAGEFLEFVDNEENFDEMVELGLAKPKVVPFEEPVREPTSAPEVNGETV